MGMVLIGIKNKTMSQSKNNVVTYGLSGMVGGMLVFKQVNGKTVVAQRPRKSNKEPTLSQLERQQKFKDAANFAKGIIKDPVYGSLYDALAGAGLSAYNVAFADFFKPPILSKAVITSYNGVIGNKIKVQVTDNVKVLSVSVSIFDANDLPIETGMATQMPNNFDWEYIVSENNPTLIGTKFRFEAIDIPENISFLEVEMI